MIAGRAAVTLDKAVIRGIALDRVQLDADVAQGLARVTTLQAEGAAIRAEAAGQVAFAGNAQSDLKYPIAVPDLSAFEKLAERPLAGNAQLDGVLTGPAGSATATGTLAAHELVAGPVNALVANSKYTVQLPDFDMARMQADATTTATFVEVGDTRLDRVEAKIKYEKEQLDLDATIEEGKRSVRVAGLVVPHPEHREAHVRQLDLAVADTHWTLPAGREAVIQYGENTLTIRGFELVNGPARMRIEGSLTPAGPGGAPAAGIDFLVEAMRVEDINAILLSDRQITGRIDATGRLTGSLKAPEITAQLKVTDGRMQDIPYNSLIGNVSYATERLTLDVNLDAGTAGQLTAKGTMPVKLGEASTTGTPPYDLQVNSSAMQVGLLQPLIPAVTSLAGTAQVNVHVTGPADSPRIDGTVGITGAAFDVVETGVRYQQLNADLFLEGQGLTVRQLSVLDSHGRPATVQGALKLPGFRSTGEFELRITANEFLVLNNDMGEVAVDLNLQASGTTAAPKITGSIEIERGRLELGTLLDQFSTPGYKAAAAPAGEPETAAKVPEGPYGNSVHRAVGRPSRQRRRARTRAALGRRADRPRRSQHHARRDVDGHQAARRRAAGARARHRGPWELRFPGAPFRDRARQRRPVQR